MLKGLDKRISIKTGLSVYIAQEPLVSVVKGTGEALKNLDKFSFLMR